MFGLPISDGAGTPKKRNIGEVYVDTLVNRGGTFDRKTLQPVVFSDGYTVAIRGVAHEYVQDAGVDWFRRVWPRKGSLVGTWVDPATSIVWVDVVVYTPFLGVARAIAAIHGEIAIWDNARGVAIAG